MTVSLTCSPWSGINTFITLLLAVVSNGLLISFCFGTLAFSNIAVPPAVLNDALNILNAKSFVWSGSHVVPFCDLNKLPIEGCLLILFSVLPNSNA